MGNNINELLERIFGNLGIELDTPKEYAINLTNFAMREMLALEWVDAVQLDNIEINDTMAEITIFSLDSAIPLDLTVKVDKNMDYNSQGVIFQTYEISIYIVTQIEYIVDEFHMAEAFILSCGVDDDLRVIDTPSIELRGDGSYLLTGEVVNSIQVNFIPLSSDSIEEEVVQKWPEYLKEKTNYNAIAMELATLPEVLKQHYEEVRKVSRWFRDRNYSPRV